MTSPRDESWEETRARLYDQAFRHARAGAWECDLASERLIWTEGVHRIFDYPTDLPLKRTSIVDLYAEESRRDMERMRAEAIRTGQGFSIDVRIRTYRGEERWMRLSVDVAAEGGRVVRIFGTKQDITADRLALEHLRAMAERDALTGLANRTVFDAHYHRIVGDTLNRGFVSALVLIDLDRFKPVNDAFGHLAGDACLQEFASRLRHAFRDAAMIARIGGDEFAVLLPAPLGRPRIAHMLRQAAAALTKPFFWNGFRLDLGCSIGAALVERPPSRKITELFAEADAALYDAKKAGRHAISIFGGDGAFPAEDRLAV